MLANFWGLNPNSLHNNGFVSTDRKSLAGGPASSEEWNRTLDTTSTPDYDIAITNSISPDATFRVVAQVN